MKTKTKISLAELAKASGISLATLKRYRAEGVNVYDTAALRQHAQGKKHPPRASDSPGMAESRKRLVDIQFERHAHFLAVAKGKHMPKEDVARNVAAFGYKLRDELLQLRHTAPLWAGMPAVDLHERAKAFEDRILGIMYDWCGWIGLHSLPTPSTKEEILAQGQALASLVPPEGFRLEANREAVHATEGGVFG